MEVCFEYEEGYLESLKENISEELRKDFGKKGDKTPVKTPVETRVKPRVKTPEAILVVLKEDRSLTLAEVAERIGKSVSAVERAAKKLGDQGRLKHVGPQKGGHWEVVE